MKKKFLTKKHMAVLLSAALAAGSLSFLPAGYADLSVVYAEEAGDGDQGGDGETTAPAFAEDSVTELTAGEEGTLKITGLTAGSTVTWKSDNKNIVDFVVPTEEAEGDEEQTEGDEVTAETKLEGEATEATLNVKAGVAGEANISATITEKATEEESDESAQAESEDEAQPLTCKITVNFKLDGVEDGTVSLDLKENKTAEITVSGVAEGTELEWTSALPEKTEDPGTEGGNEGNEEETDSQADTQTGDNSGDNTGNDTTGGDSQGTEGDNNQEGDGDQEENPENPDNPGTGTPSPEEVATIAFEKTGEEEGAKDDTTKATITAVGVGEINVTVAIKQEEGTEEQEEEAASDWKQQTFTVKVVEGDGGDDPGDETVEVTSITLDQTSLSLNKGETAVLEATVLPDNATNPAVTWSTSDAGIAAVEDGTVTAMGKGTATITAKAGEQTATCEVTVNEPGTTVVEVDSITLDQTSLSLNKGATAVLKATVAPANATNPAVTWSTSDPAIATVANGTVTAVEKGTATITAKAGNQTATCTVTVNVPETPVVEVTSITLDQTSLSLNKGATAILKATVAPANATNPAVTWSSDNAGVATVENGTVTAVEKGTATITAKAGNQTATCTVTVNVPETKVTVPATKVSLNTKQIYMVKGKSINVKATVTPSNTTDKLTWSTSNKKVATVKNGKISAKKTGNATITAKAGSKKATVKVSVVSKAKKATKVTLNKKKATLKAKKTLTLKATMKPAKSTDTLKWSSSNKKVAKVDKFGTVTAVKKGKATITVKTSSGKKATCQITVK